MVVTDENLGFSDLNRFRSYNSRSWSSGSLRGGWFVSRGCCMNEVGKAMRRRGSGGSKSTRAIL